MFTTTRFALSLAIILGIAMAKEPAYRTATPKPQRQLSAGGNGSRDNEHGFKTAQFCMPRYDNPVEPRIYC